MHRVVNPEPGTEQAGSGRLSVAFFTGPRDDAMVEVLETCADADHPPNYEPI